MKIIKKQQQQMYTPQKLLAITGTRSSPKVVKEGRSKTKEINKKFKTDETHSVLNLQLLKPGS